MLDAALPRLPRRRAHVCVLTGSRAEEVPRDLLPALLSGARIAAADDLLALVDDALGQSGCAALVFADGERVVVPVVPAPTN